MARPITEPKRVYPRASSVSGAPPITVNGKLDLLRARREALRCVRMAEHVQAFAARMEEQKRASVAKRIQPLPDALTFDWPQLYAIARDAESANRKMLAALKAGGRTDATDGRNGRAHPHATDARDAVSPLARPVLVIKF